MSEIKVYVAGKVSKDSHFAKHHWRDEFCAELAELSGRQIVNLDPLNGQTGDMSPQEIFAKDCQLIAKADVLVVYLTNDISVGGSQEVLIARYLHKPVIGLAPKGGKFNGATREMFGKTITDYKDPFVFSTCDVVCATIEEVANELKSIERLRSTGMKIIDDAISDIS